MVAAMIIMVDDDDDDDGWLIYNFSSLLNNAINKDINYLANILSKFDLINCIETIIIKTI